MSEEFNSWQITSLRSVAASSTDSFTDGDWIEAPFITDEGIRLIQTGNIGKAEFLEKADSRKYISNSSFRLLNCKPVNPGDLLVCRLADPIGRACEVPSSIGDAITSVDCTIVRVDSTRFDKRFVLHWLNSEKNLKNALDRAAGSTRSRISRSNLGKLPIPKPKLSEQSLISKVLDTLDTAIRETEALIDKLKAVKQGLLHDLLTRGIDANGELRPPQIEAPQLYKESPLGWIPKEWDAESLSKVIDLTSGQHIPTELCNSVGRGVPYFTGPSDFLGAGTVVTQYTTCPQVMCDEDDILITVKGSGCGKVAVAGVRACISRQLMSIKVPAQSLQYWLAVFQRLQERFNRLATGGNIPGISRAQILELVVATPARIEEAAEIGGRIQTINERIVAEECGLEKLRLKKNGLMDDLLTGRVRVTPLLESVQQPAAQMGA